jgi:ketopantoate reductase
MELEVVLGYVVKAAKEHHVNVPVSPGALDLYSPANKYVNLLARGSN